MLVFGVEMVPYDRMRYAGLRYEQCKEAFPSLNTDHVRNMKAEARGGTQGGYRSVIMRLW